MASRSRKKMQGFQPTLSRPQSQQELGFTGTVILSGFIIGEEYNQDLVGKKGLEVYDQMRRNDATVAASLDVVKLPILAADWFLEPASEDEKDIFICDAIRHVLFEDCETSFFEMLRQGLGMLDFGFVPFELVYKTTEFSQEVTVDDEEGETVPDGDESPAPIKAADMPDPESAPTQTPDPKKVENPKVKKMPPVTIIGLKKLAYRKPLSVYKWIDDKGEPGITQRAKDGRTAFIPMDKLVVFTHKREGDNFEGVSVLRTAYKHWYIKDSLYKIEAMKFERQGLGIPHIKLPPNATANDRMKAEEILSNMRANEGGYLAAPSNFEVDFMDMKAGQTADMQDSIQHHDRQIMMNVLAAFLEMGSHSGSGGSRASSQDHQKLFQQGLEAVAKNLKETIDRYVIQRLVDINWPGSAYPRLRFEKIVGFDPLEFGQAVAQLAASGVFTKDKSLEGAVRGIYNIPELPENPEYSQPMDLLGDTLRGEAVNPGQDEEEESSQNIDDDFFPEKSTGDTVKLKASEALRRARDAKAAVDRTLGLL